MAEIPESLLRRSAEAQAKALGVPVESVLAQMKGEAPAIEVDVPETPAPEEPPAPAVESAEDVPLADDDVVSDEDTQDPAATGDQLKDAERLVEPAPEGEPPSDEPAADEPASEPAADEPAAEPAADEPAADEPAADEPAGDEPADVAPPPESASVAGDGKVAGVVSARPAVPPTGLPEGVRTQRLLTVVKARAIQTVKPDPTDKVNTWPHLMLAEFGAILAMIGFLLILSVIIHSPLLDPANINATPNPSKAPWYFLGLQEMLSYFDPQIAGVIVPTIVGFIGFMAIPYVDRNPSTKPSDRKFAIMAYSMFLAGAATLTIIGVLFRGEGFNFTYPWKDGVFFDDLRDWVNFE